MTFSVKLMELLASKRKIVYMDETSFQCWDWPRKVFRFSGEKHYVSIPSSRGEGLTIIGGITTDGEFHYIIRSTTNKENVQ